MNQMPDVSYLLIPDNIKDYDDKLWEIYLEKCQK